MPSSRETVAAELSPAPSAAPDMPDLPKLTDERPLRVAIYLNDLSGGGVERMKLQLIPALRRCGADVELILHATKGELGAIVPRGIKVTAFETSRVLSDILPMARYLRHARPDVLLSSLNHNNLVACLAGLLSGSGVRVFITQHNALSMEAAPGESWKYRSMPLAYRLVSPAAAGIIAVSRGVAEDMARLTRIPLKKIETIYNPVVSDELFARAQESADHPWFEEPAIPIFVTAGRLVPQKDHMTLLQAFALYRRQQPGRLMIFGSGPLRESLRDTADTLGIAPDVAFMGFSENPLPYYRHARAFVLSSKYEGFGNVLVEALACGVPVISTNCPYGPSEILDDGRFGTLVPVNDPPALAAAMLADLRTLYPAATLQARAQMFTLDAAARHYLSYFRQKLRN